MNAALRHLSVRMWLTALAGGLAAIALVPWWQQALGVEQLVFPASIIMLLCFAGAGWGMNRVGMGFLRRHVNDATAWERAGMMTEAEQAFGKAMATFDSFWLSPLWRRGQLRWFSAAAARFYLGQQSSRSFPRQVVAVHLKHFPEDKDVAEPWLEQLLTCERHFPAEHEAVAGVGEALAGHPPIQRLLMQFYLANGRVDFDALQTYRRVWRRHQMLPDDTVLRLARLLRNECFLNHWALRVYLKAYAKGDKGAVEGIAAAVRWLPITEESQRHLEISRKVLEKEAYEHPGELDIRFKPDRAPATRAPKSTGGEKISAVQLKKALADTSQRVGQTWHQLVEGILPLFSDRRMLRTMALTSAALVLGGIVFIAVWQMLRDTPAPRVAGGTVEQRETAVPLEKKAEITDPFTIQVAAYLKTRDAQRNVDELRRKSLDAFYTQATNAKGRTWYQVKVAHFPDRQGAEMFGQDLKSKGVINDFYVANYAHALRNDIKNN